MTCDSLTAVNCSLMSFNWFVSKQQQQKEQKQATAFQTTSTTRNYISFSILHILFFKKQ